MPLSAPTVLITSTVAIATDPFTTGSVTPTANALVIVLVSAVTNAGTPDIVGITSTLSGMGTWTEIADIAHSAGTKALAAAWYSIAGASPGTGTITVDASSAFARWTVTVAEIASGYDTSTPAINAKTGTGTSATPSLTLDSSPAATSIVMGIVTSLGDDGITPGAAYVELVDATSGGSNAARQEIEYDSTPGSTTVDWSDAGVTSNAFLAFEIKAAAAGAKAFVFPSRAFRLWNKWR